MRWIKAVSILLLIVLPNPLLAANVGREPITHSPKVEPEAMSKGLLPLKEYLYQSAVFYYLTQDYLSLSVVSEDFLKISPKEKDRMMLLLKLSDLNRFSISKLPPLTSQISPDENLFAAGLLDLSYRAGAYDEVLNISTLSGDKGMARYYEGMGLFRQNKLKEASSALAQVLSNDRFYPYAMIALSQIEVIRHNLDKAEEHLRTLLSYPDLNKTSLTAKVHLMLGQVLFEKGAYSIAEEEFSKVTEEGLKNDAQIGRAWSLVKLGNYEKAAPLMRGMTLTPPYSPVEWEIQILSGYCYLKTDKGGKGIDHFQELLDTYSRTEDRLDQIIKDETAIRRYRSTLFRGGSLQPTSEELHYLADLQNDPVITRYLKGYEQLQALKAALLKRDRDAEKMQISIDNKIKMGEAMLEDMDKMIIQPIQNTNTVIGKTRYKAVNDVTFFSTWIFNYWHQVLGREVSDDTKWLVEQILQKFMYEENHQCRGIPILCHLVSLFSGQKIKETPEQVREIVDVLESISKDLKSVSKGEKIKFEVIASRLREKGNIMNKAMEALWELAKVRDEIKKTIPEIDRGSSIYLAELDRRIAERFQLAKYELADYRERIVAGLNLAMSLK